MTPHPWVGTSHPGMGCAPPPPGRGWLKSFVLIHRCCRTNRSERSMTSTLRGPPYPIQITIDGPPPILCRVGGGSPLGTWRSALSRGAIMGQMGGSPRPSLAKAAHVSYPPHLCMVLAPFWQWHFATPHPGHMQALSPNFPFKFPTERNLPASRHKKSVSVPGPPKNVPFSPTNGLIISPQDTCSHQYLRFFLKKT